MFVLYITGCSHCSDALWAIGLVMWRKSQHKQRQFNVPGHPITILPKDLHAIDYDALCTYVRLLGAL